jgi:hypothetical protein
MQIPSLCCGMTSKGDCAKGNAGQTRMRFGNDKQKGNADADSFASLRNDKRGRLREVQCSADADALWE